MTDRPENVLTGERIEVRYRGGNRRQPVRAVRGVSVALSPGETLGIVGESGCGKSSLAWALAGLTPLAAGRILHRGRVVADTDSRPGQAFHRAVQIVFQDPLGALNPRLTVGQALEEVLAVHRPHNGLGCRARRERAIELLEDAGLGAAFRDRYPHELSGGQRQRAGIARALAVDPEVLIADEPVSALDVSVQVRILNLLRDLNTRRGMGLILISHDLAVVRYLCQRVMVMYLGTVLEQGFADALFARCSHPYTEALMSAVPDLDRVLAGGGSARRIVLQGDTPSPRSALPGCPFRPRCLRATARCGTTMPVLRETSSGVFAACHDPVSIAGREVFAHDGESRQRSLAARSTVADRTFRTGVSGRSGDRHVNHAEPFALPRAGWRRR